MKPYWTRKNFALAMMLLLTTSMTNAAELSGHISGFVGLKIMNRSDWGGIGQHFSSGFIFDI